MRRCREIVNVFENEEPQFTDLLERYFLFIEQHLNFLLKIMTLCPSLNAIKITQIQQASYKTLLLCNFLLTHLQFMYNEWENYISLQKILDTPIIICINKIKKKIHNISHLIYRYYNRNTLYYQKCKNIIPIILNSCFFRTKKMDFQYNDVKINPPTLFI